MQYLISFLIILIIAEHLYFLWLEMFAWTTRGKKVFTSLPKHMFEPTKHMAANQGLYNGFLAAGLLWSLFITNHEWSWNVSIFFLSCILVAGIYGGLSVHKKIFYVQGIPALITLILLHF